MLDVDATPLPPPTASAAASRSCSRWPLLLLFLGLIDSGGALVHWTCGRCFFLHADILSACPVRPLTLYLSASILEQRLHPALAKPMPLASVPSSSPTHVQLQRPRSNPPCCCPQQYACGKATAKKPLSLPLSMCMCTCACDGMRFSSLPFSMFSCLVSSASRSLSHASLNPQHGASVVVCVPVVRPLPSTPSPLLSFGRLCALDPSSAHGRRGSEKATATCAQSHLVPRVEGQVEASVDGGIHVRSVRLPGVQQLEASSTASTDGARVAMFCRERERDARVVDCRLCRVCFCACLLCTPESHTRTCRAVLCTFSLILHVRLSYSSSLPRHLPYFCGATYATASVPPSYPSLLPSAYSSAPDCEVSPLQTPRSHRPTYARSHRAGRVSPSSSVACLMQ